MAGTIFISDDVRFGIRTIDFEWIAQELQSRITDANRSALEAVLFPHDEGGMDMLFAHKLDADGFRQFANALDDLVSHVQSKHAESAILEFLERVQGAVHSDSRWTDNHPR